MTACAPAARHAYSLYGVHVTSDVPLAFPASAGDSAPDALAAVEFVEGTPRDFAPFLPHVESDDEDVCRRLPGGATYLRWARLYEFSVAADGSRVASRPLDGCDAAVFQNFLFGQVLAVALVLQGVEPLHAAVVNVDGSAVGFLGDCTFGKSTLLASFVRTGHRALTDDLLVVDRRAGGMLARPGSGRIKLRPDSAQRVLPDAGEGTPLNPMTSKRAFTLDASRQERSGVPLRMLFVLPDPDERDRTAAIDIRPVSPAEMVHELLKNTSTCDVADAGRLARQFESAADIASSVEGFVLRYPSGLHHLDTVRRAIVDHVRTRTSSRVHPMTETGI